MRQEVQLLEDPPPPNSGMGSAAMGDKARGIESQGV